MFTQIEDQETGDANPGPYLDNDGSYYFDIGVDTFGPYDSEDEAEQAFVEAETLAIAYKD